MPESRRLRLPVPVSFVGLVLLAVAAGGTSGCAQPHRDVILSAFQRNARKAGPDVPTPDREIRRDARTGERSEDRSYLDMPGGTRLNHGVHRTWYPDGTPETFRSFDRGEPAGVWWTWWQSGALRSSYVFDRERPTRMTWWHANGFLASDGMARNGTRTGAWRFWHENGALESEGEFVGGRRSGPWVFYDEDGEWTERGTFSSGRRVGDWEFRGRDGRF